MDIKTAMLLGLTGALSAGQAEAEVFGDDPLPFAPTGGSAPGWEARDYRARTPEQNERSVAAAKTKRERRRAKRMRDARWAPR